MFTRVIMDFAKILVITITEKQFLYAKNNIFDADRSVVSERKILLLLAFSLQNRSRYLHWQYCSSK